MERIIKRGDIYYAELNPVIGSEQGGTRPVLIISNDIGNKHSPTVIIAAITSRVHTKAKLPTHIPVSNYEGLDTDSVILLEQIRTIDKNSLKRFADREEMEIVDIYEDAGKSGKSIEGRPAFKKMLSDIKNGLEIERLDAPTANRDFR